MTTTIITNSSKDEFFDGVHELCDKLRTNPTVSHVYILAVHGHDETAEVSEDGMRIRAPITFMHNQADVYNAAVQLNNVAALVALQELSESEKQTRQ